MWSNGCDTVADLKTFYIATAIAIANNLNNGSKFFDDSCKMAISEST